MRSVVPHDGDPVMPRSVCLSFVAKFFTSFSTAVCCPCEVWYGEISSNCMGFSTERDIGIDPSN